MNFIAGIFLMYMDEEDSFWALVTLLKHKSYNLSGLYSPGLPLLQQWFSVFKHLLAVHCQPFLDHLAHLQQEEEIPMPIQPDSYGVTRWFMTLFIAVMPLDMSVRVLDLLLFSGVKIIFQIAIFLIKRNTPEILKMDYDQFLQSKESLFEGIPIDNLINGALGVYISDNSLTKLFNKTQSEASSYEFCPASKVHKNDNMRV